MASRVLVTGGRGLIGTATCKLLADESVEIIYAEEAVPDSNLLIPGVAKLMVGAAKPDLVLHLAWVASSTQGYRHHPDNAKWVGATLEIHEACHRQGARLVATGSVAELDSHSTDAYCQAKRSLWMQLSRVIDEQIISWMRPYYVFDPFSGSPEVLGEILLSIREQRPPALRSPEARHDFVHLDDVARAITSVVKHDLGGLIEIGAGHSRSVADLARAAGATFNSQVADALAGSPVREADIQVLRSVGWHPQCTEAYFSGHDDLAESFSYGPER